MVFTWPRDVDGSDSSTLPMSNVKVISSVKPERSIPGYPSVCNSSLSLIETGKAAADGSIVSG